MSDTTNNASNANLTAEENDEAKVPLHTVTLTVCGLCLATSCRCPRNTGDYRYTNGERE